MPDGDMPDDGYYFGSDFLRHHDIRHQAWDLGTHQGRHGRARSWAIRLERRGEHGAAYVWTWTRTINASATAIDWDDAISEAVRDAEDGRLSFDAYVTENLCGTTSATVNRDEYRMWVAATAVWLDAREFLGWDDALLASFFSVVPNEI